MLRRFPPESTHLQRGGFYNGTPTALSVRKWALAWASVAVGFAALVLLPQTDNFVALIPRILFVGIPLVVLAMVTREHWTALFRKVHGRDVLTMIGVAVLNLVVTSVLALIVRALFGGVASNKAVDGAGEGGALDTAAFYVGTGIQLVGEEVFTIVPFLALMYFLFAKAKLSRKTAIVLLAAQCGVVRRRPSTNLRLELRSGLHRDRRGGPTDPHTRLHPHQESVGLVGRAHHQRLDALHPGDRDQHRLVTL